MNTFTQMMRDVCVYSYIMILDLKLLIYFFLIPRYIIPLANIKFSILRN